MTDYSMTYRHVACSSRRPLQLIELQKERTLACIGGVPFVNPKLLNLAYLRIMAKSPTPNTLNS